LLEKEQCVTMSDDEEVLFIAPPVILAELPENMQFINAGDEVWLNIAPPLWAVLPENVQPVIMGEE
jgi:hypothetical protein